ncbi:hypothetical protein ACOSQ2_017218 [Xanthoceras sorbifolium]
MANEGTQGKSKAIWDPRTHEIWVDLAVDQVRAGNRNGTHLSKQGWKNFIQNFNNATSRNYDRKQLKKSLGYCEKRMTTLGFIGKRRNWTRLGHGKANC